MFNLVSIFCAKLLLTVAIIGTGRPCLVKKSDPKCMACLATAAAKSKGFQVSACYD